MSVRTINFTNGEIEKLARNPDGQTYSDKGCKGLKARAATDGTVTFTVIKRIKGGQRISRIIGVYDAERFNVKLAREEAGGVKVLLKDPKHAPKVTKTLDDMIDETTALRLNATASKKSRKKAGLPKDWITQCKKVRAMCKPILHRDIEILTVKDFDKSKTDHLLAIAKKKKKTITPGEKLNDKPLGKPCALLRQVLELAIKQGRQTEEILDACLTGEYDDRPRFLLPREWQRAACAYDYLPHDGGLLPRFLLATAARLNTALNMTWDELSEPRKREWHAEHPVRKWHTTVKHNHKVTIYLTGEALRIIDHFAEHKKQCERLHEENSKRTPADYHERKAFKEIHANATRKTVFTKKIIQMWRKYGWFYQRKLEEAIETVPFTRQDLRRTLATYMKYAGGSQLTAANALTHTVGGKHHRREEAAPRVTGVYTKDDKIAGDFLAEATLTSANTGVMYQVVAAHVRVQTLFKQIERGEHSPTLEDMEDTLEDEGDNMVEMLIEKKVNKAYVFIESPAEHAAWKKRAKLAEWGSKLEPELKAIKAAEQSQGRLDRIAKKKATAVRAEKSANAVAATG